MVRFVIPLKMTSHKIVRHSECNEKSPYAHPFSRFSRSYGDSSVEDSFRMTEGNCLIVIALFSSWLGGCHELLMTLPLIYLL